MTVEKPDFKKEAETFKELFKLEKVQEYLEINRRIFSDFACGKYHDIDLLIDYVNHQTAFIYASMDMLKDMMSELQLWRHSGYEESKRPSQQS